MIDTKKSEKGAIIVEIIAVIALLGVMGPLLFKQVLTRNEEVENINMASEIRVMKEALSAYILTNKQIILNESSGCQPNVELLEYLPVGMDVVINDYVNVVCTFGSDSAAPNFVQGFVIPTAAVLPEDFGLKRAARVANLIGSDGGIYYNGQINGTSGGWGLDESQIEEFDGLGIELEKTLADAGNIRAVYVASTGMDSYLPEYIVEDYSAGFVTIPDRLAFEELHASNYFSIGSGGTNCYTKKHNTMNISDAGYTAADDVIKRPETGGCDPLFWVGTGGAGAKDKEGSIYVKKGLSVGYVLNDGATGARNSIAIMPANEETSVDTVDFKEQNRIEVYDANGKAKVIISGDGQIVARSSQAFGTGKTKMNDTDEFETLTIADGQIKTNIKAVEASSSEGVGDIPYKIDPAYTSVMHDIRLESRGGARLSDILPNYITKGIYDVSNFQKSVPMPNCPRGYAPAIVVLPTYIDGTVLFDSDLDDLVNADNMKMSFSVDEQGASTHTHKVELTNVKFKSSEAKLAASGLTVKINSVANSETGIQKGAEATSDPASTLATSGNWTVEFFNHDGTSIINSRGLAHTYCVFDKDVGATSVRN